MEKGTFGHDLIRNNSEEDLRLLEEVQRQNRENRLKGMLEGLQKE